jgi:phosphopantetheinyl transferase
MVGPAAFAPLAAPPTSAVEIWLVDVARCGGGLQQIWDEATGAGLVPCNERSGASTWTEQGSAAGRPPGGKGPDVKRLTRLCLRLLLARTLGDEALHEPFDYGPQGKPALATGRLHFSVSHTGTMALVAIGASGPIGADLELVRAPRLSAWRREQLERFAEDLGGCALPEGDPDRRFIQAWVRLEAYGKATGEGVGALLERYRHPQAAHELVSPALKKDFTVHDLDTGESTLAAAVAAGDASVPTPLRQLPCDVGRMAELLRPPRHANTGPP